MNEGFMNLESEICRELSGLSVEELEERRPGALHGDWAADAPESVKAMINNVIDLLIQKELRELEL